MTFKKIVIGSLWLLAGAASHAQDMDGMADSVVYMGEVVITGQRVRDFAVGASIQKFKPEEIRPYKSNSIGDFLRFQSGVNINSYGLGGLSTASARGGGSSHTPVIWNGFNVQSPMNGGLNLNLLPLVFFDDVQVQYGGAGTLYGSGVMTGAIYLGNPDLQLTEDKATLLLGGGSFGNRSIAAKAKFGGGRFHGSLGATMQQADNDFTFTNRARFGRPEQTQTNAGFRQAGIMQENQWITGERSYLKTSLWYQHFHKDIQTLMTTTVPSKASQEDNDLRASVSWNRNTAKLNTAIRSAFLYNELLYRDPDGPSPVSNHYTYSSINEVENKFLLSENQSLNAGINYTLEKAISDGYNEDFVRNRVSAFANYRVELFDSRVVAVLSAREELFNGATTPLVYSLGANYRVHSALTLKASASKNYRIPTFNDLYWRTTSNTSGNPDLVPESGWNYETGFTWKAGTSKFAFEVDPSLYYSKINNWIIWMPDNMGVWKPENKKAGKTLGAEIRYRAQYRLNPWKFSSSGFYHYTQATISESFQGGEADEREPAYIPRDRWKADLAISYKNAGVQYIHNFYGRRLYDNSNYLDAYHLGAVKINYDLEVASSNLQVGFTVENVWDTEYEIVAWYAMPGRNYHLSLMYALNFKQHK